MKAFLALILLASACTSNRPAAINAPADGAEYYQPYQPLAVVQPRLYPDPQGGLGHSQDPDIRVTDIKLTASYTVLYLTFGKDPNGRDNNYYGTSSISFNPKAVLASADGKKTYALVKTEGIPMTPESREIKNDEKVPFVLYFERLDKGVESFDLFECKSDNQNSCFNVAGMAIHNPLSATATQN
ncbi:hypothetical protein EXU85_29490 [Spirosoma sp. KCTC 42546]|uniref:hypothetical protein n=1 Tax=Spirosoma sp. KCTC 42546 TaxID=2520506 RepID=UPI001157D88E|nr:hypothetical protein [Spirosoma sp. KCTC 42546]QDK82519.1 hypothetical protein EXU85_29490 [Spirosoma sp. KCTC 42546]